MKVLLATDGSEHAENAAWFLSHLPHSERLDLLVLSVQPQLPLHGSTEVMAWMDEQRKFEKEGAGKACERVEEMFQGANASVETATCEGHPGKEIVKLARDRGLDLIVLGAEGHSVVERMLLGSVSDFVATHAHCSVLIVRPTGLREREHQQLTVTVAYDGSAPSKYAVEELKNFDWHHHTKFNVINIMEFPAVHMDVPISIDMEPVRAAMLVAAQEAVTKLRELSPNVDSRVIESGHVGDSIVESAEDDGSDLIVIGNTGHGLVGQFLLGGASRYVVRHARCSVWIAREGRDAQDEP